MAYDNEVTLEKIKRVMEKADLCWGFDASEDDADEAFVTYSNLSFYNNTKTGEVEAWFQVSGSEAKFGNIVSMKQAVTN